MIQLISRSRKDDQRGFALVVVLLAMLIMSALTAVMVQNIVAGSDQNSHQVQVTNALTAADAGVTDMINTLSGNWGGTFIASYCTPGPYQTGVTYTCGNTAASPGWYPSSSTWTTVGNGQYRAHIYTCSLLTQTRLNSTGCNSSSDEVLTVQGRYNSTGSATQTVQVVLRNQAGGPAAFNYAMFADKGIQVHHHGDSYISPTIVTTSMHSNGFITLNYPAIYRVNDMEASGAITLADGGGSIPSGSVTSSYNWPYWISGTDTTNPERCYPALQYPSLSYTSTYWATPTGSGTGSSCSGNPQWSPHAVVVGNIFANSVEVKSNGDTQSPTGTVVSGSTQWTPEAQSENGVSTCGSGTTSQAGFNDPVTGACIQDLPGNIDAGSVKFDATNQTYTGKSTAPNCTGSNNSSCGTYVYTSSSSSTTGFCAGQTNPCNQAVGNTSGLTTCSACNQGTSDTGGHIGGQLNLHVSSWAPPSIPFPSFNFTANTLPTAEVDQGNAKTSTAVCGTLTSNPYCHVFSSASTFLTWMETASNAYLPTGSYPTTGTYPADNPCTNSAKACMVWLNSSYGYTNTPSQVAYVLLFGNYELQGSGNLTLTESSLRSAFGTGSTAATPTIMVAGALVNESGGINLTASLTVVGPKMNPFNPLESDAAIYADANLGSGTVPGLLASGGTGTAITSTDYDTDSPYTSSSNYQSIYKNQVIVRGLVYTGAYSSSTQTSTASDQHWHNADPKNAQIIVGAQIGGTLHDCSNFTFSYDTLIENLTGFGGSSGGGIYVVDWTQL